MIADSLSLFGNMGLPRKPELFWFSQSRKKHCNTVPNHQGERGDLVPGPTIDACRSACLLLRLFLKLCT